MMTKREALQRRNETIEDFLSRLVYPSWTWDRLTLQEQWRFEDTIADMPLAGTQAQKIKALNFAYHMFLLGTGYKPIGWREPENRADEIPAF